jgi:hypothetical protein
VEADSDVRMTTQLGETGEDVRDRVVEIAVQVD